MKVGPMIFCSVALATFSDCALADPPGFKGIRIGLDFAGWAEVSRFNCRPGLIVGRERGPLLPKGLSAEIVRECRLKRGERETIAREPVGEIIVGLGSSGDVRLIDVTFRTDFLFPIASDGVRAAMREAYGPETRSVRTERYGFIADWDVPGGAYRLAERVFDEEHFGVPRTDGRLFVFGVRLPPFDGAETVQRPNDL